MKIYLDMVGCRLNQSELEEYARRFQAAGHELTGDPSQADLAVVNTCSVTVAAAADSRKMIRRLSRQGAGEVVVTGCWSTLEPAAARALPGVSRLVDNLSKDQLVSSVLDNQRPEFQEEPVDRVLIPGARLRTRANIKAQDGCDHRCTYCLTTAARGPGRSLPVEEVLDRVRAAVRGGAQEVVLTGVQLGSWGKDLPDQPGLHGLVEAVLAQTEAPRLRLSSIEPWDVGPALIDLLSSSRVARHLHLPLQSGSDRVLRRMARPIRRKEYAGLVDMIRRTAPETAITTDVMTGFPGETEDDFQNTVDFVRQMNFADGHVFTYSSRPGTPAAAMEDQVDHAVRKARNARLREVLSASSREYRTRFLGKTVEVLWESVTGSTPSGWTLQGISDNYLRVETVSRQELWNQLTGVVLTSLTDQGLTGEIEPEQPEGTPSTVAPTKGGQDE